MNEIICDGELFLRCFKAEAEVRIQGLICAGLVGSFYKQESSAGVVLVLNLIPAIQRKTPQSEKEYLEFQEFRMFLRKKPIIIQDGNYDCIHFCTETGSIDIYFSKPSSHRTWD